MYHVAPAHQRIAQWLSKYNPDRVRELIEENKQRWSENAYARFAEQAAMEMAVKQELHMSSATTCQVASYLCFGREMWKAVGKYSGSMLAREAGVKIQKWVSRKLDPEILARICFQVFSVQPEMP
jgi:hypothetical protein